MCKGKVPAPPGLKRHDKIVAKIVKQLKEKLIMPKSLKRKTGCRVTITGNISSNAPHSMDAVASLRLLSPGGMFLSFSTT